GERPWRLVGALEARRYAECDVAATSAAARVDILRRAAPGATGEDVATVGRRWPLAEPELRAAVAVARTAVALSSGERALGAADLDEGCAVVSAVSSGELVAAITPRRGPDVLVLPDDVHRSVVEIAAFTQVMATVTEG